MSFCIRNTPIINEQTAYVDLAGTSAVKVPTGTTAQRPANIPFQCNSGRIRYNTSCSQFEGQEVSQLWGRFEWCVPKRALWTWGEALCGQLGDGTTVDKCSPVQEVTNSTDWCAINSGPSKVALKHAGSLWSWGHNACGVLGDGTTTDRCSPVRERSSTTNWCQQDTGNFHVGAVKTDGSLWTWGSNLCGQLGIGNTTPHCSPVRERCSATDWKRVAPGAYHTAALKTSGQIWTWGQGACGRLGNGTTTTICSPVREFCSATDWCTIHSGRPGSGAVKTSGQFWAWGCNALGSLGDGTTTDRYSPVREICSATDWCAVNLGAASVGIKTNGQLWVWGDNGCGRLATGTTISTSSPVREFCSATDWCKASIGAVMGAGLKTSGQMWLWGRGSRGALGNGSTACHCSPVREFYSKTSWIDVCAGGLSPSALEILVRPI